MKLGAGTTVVHKINVWNIKRSFKNSSLILVALYDRHFKNFKFFKKIPFQFSICYVMDTLILDNYVILIEIKNAFGFTCQIENDRPLLSLIFSSSALKMISPFLFIIYGAAGFWDITVTNHYSYIIVTNHFLLQDLYWLRNLIDRLSWPHWLKNIPI